MSDGRVPILSASQAETLWRPQADETVLWQGAPNAIVLARTAFRTPVIAGYFVLLAAIAVLFGGGLGGAAVTLLAGAAVMAILYAIALVSARTTRYILTDRRIILHVGMAIEKTINLPLAKIGAADLADRGHGYGEIALEVIGGHSLGYLLLWPHARPWRFSHPQPMMRGLANAATVAERLAKAVAAHNLIERPGAIAVPSAPAPTIEGALA